MSPENRPLAVANGPPAHAPCILIVEDNRDTLDLLTVLVRGDFAPDHIYKARSVQEALEALGRHPIDIMFLDPGLPDAPSNQYTIRTVMKAAPLVATVVLTGATNAADRGEALLQGARGYYDKTDVIIKWKEMALIRQLLAEVRASDG